MSDKAPMIHTANTSNIKDVAIGITGALCVIMLCLILRHSLFSLLVAESIKHIGKNT